MGVYIGAVIKINYEPFDLNRFCSTYFF